MSSLCTFDSPDFTRIGSAGAIPTFSVDPTNTNYPSVTGGTVCSFPTHSGLLASNTITPSLIGPNKATTTCGYITYNANLLGNLLSNGQAIYTAMSCPGVQYNMMPTGTYTLGFSEQTGPAFSPWQFVIASATTSRSSVYATITSQATLSQAPAQTVTSSSNVVVPLTVTLAASPSATTTTLAYSATLVNTVLSTLAAGSTVTATQYTTTTFSTIMSNSTQFLTQVVTNYHNATNTQFETSTLTATPFTTTLSLQSCSSSPVMSSSSPSSSATSVVTSSTDTAVSPITKSTSTLTSTPNPSSSASSSISSVLNISSTSTSTPNPSSSASSSISSTLNIPSIPSPVSAFACPSANGTISTMPDGKQFLLEIGCDRQAGQMAVRQVSSFTECMTACANLSGCSSVSYTGSWCYLKQIVGPVQLNANIFGARLIGTAAVSSASATATGVGIPTPTSVIQTTSPSVLAPLACPSSNNVTYVTASGSQYLIECQTDHSGGDLSMTWQSTLEGCIASCDSNAGCVDASWQPGGPGPCYLKNKILATSTASLIWGARKIAAIPVASPSVLSTLTTGPALASASASPSPNAGGMTTSSISKTSTTSAAAVAISSSAAICTKGFVNASTSLNNPAANGLCYTDSVGDIYLVEAQLDRPGGDMGMTWTSSLEWCIAACSGAPGCVDISFVPSFSPKANGPCYMKSVANKASSSNTVLGALLVQKASTASPAGLVKRAAKVGAPDYTYPQTPAATTVTIGTSTVVQTITPAAAPPVTITAVSTSYTTLTVVPSSSGMATRTITTGTTTFTTSYITPTAPATVVQQAASTSLSTQTIAFSVTITSTVEVQQTETMDVTIVKTVDGGTVTVTTQGCFATGMALARRGLVGRM